MKTKEQKTRAAVANLRKHNHTLAANKLEQSIEIGTIELKPTRSFTEGMIYVALVFADLEITKEANPFYTFETK